MDNKIKEDEEMFGTNNEGWYVFWSAVGLVIAVVGILLIITL